MVQVLFLQFFFLGEKLREYVDDTEDYINIMLDDKQNHLLQMGVMLTTATLVVSGFVVVAGIFGMNIKIDLYKKGMPLLFRFVGGGIHGTIFLFTLLLGASTKRHFGVSPASPELILHFASLLLLLLSPFPRLSFNGCLSFFSLLNPRSAAFFATDLSSLISNSAASRSVFKPCNLRPVS
ncbi:hypothetical protein IFM89_007895 [Coptis chinensis]|uniref:Uncharacterized protein n=1 Tax=Coptis chinensis TaxID=261450 RepID=A0A835LHX3_9MAGN|nr:hypothetical protein IFM89_007895 [Coptis chinensis]